MKLPPFSEIRPRERLRAFLEQVANEPDLQLTATPRGMSGAEDGGLSADVRSVLEWFGGTEYRWRVSGDVECGVFLSGFDGWHRGPHGGARFGDAVTWRQLDDASPESPIYLVTDGDAEVVHGSALSEEADARRIGDMRHYIEHGLDACFVAHWARPTGPSDEALQVARARCAGLFERALYGVSLKSREATEDGWERIELRVEDSLEHVYAADVLGWLADAAPATLGTLFDVHALKFGNRSWGQSSVVRDIARKASGKGTLVTAEVPAILVGIEPTAAWQAVGVTSTRFKWTTRASLEISPVRPGTALATFLAALKPAAPKRRPAKRPATARTARRVK